MNRSLRANHSGFGRLGASILVLIVAATAACAGSSTQSGPKFDLTVGALLPFTGADGFFGPPEDAACLPAARVINANGGVMGHMLKCGNFDTRGDPADAVPAARQMIGSNPNLMVVIGCTGDEASAVVPILNANHTPMFCLTGQSEFNQSSFTYFHRLIPPDAYEAYAMVGIALFVNHYTRIALVFGNDIGSQTFVGPAQKAIQNLGGTVVINQALALGQSSYRTEVEKLIQANPQVILTEAMGPTGATYLSELKQLNHGLIPLIGSSSLIDPAIFQALSAAVGVNDLIKYLTADSLETNFGGVAFDEFKNNLLASAAQLDKPDQYLGIPDVLHEYDGIVMTGLAMVAANSTDPKVYNSWIVKVGNGYGSNPTEVHTYKEGLDALSQGKTIRFVGAGGPTHFDQWNNSQGGYVIVKYDATGAAQTVGKLTPDQVNQLVHAGGG